MWIIPRSQFGYDNQVPSPDTGVLVKDIIVATVGWCREVVARAGPPHSYCSVCCKRSEGG